jgi:hypothetical protein
MTRAKKPRRISSRKVVSLSVREGELRVTVAGILRSGPWAK